MINCAVLIVFNDDEIALDCCDEDSSALFDGYMIAEEVRIAILKSLLRPRLMA